MEAGVDILNECFDSILGTNSWGWTLYGALTSDPGSNQWFWVIFRHHLICVNVAHETQMLRRNLRFMRCLGKTSCLWIGLQFEAVFSLPGLETESWTASSLWYSAGIIWSNNFPCVLCRCLISPIQSFTAFINLKILNSPDLKQFSIQMCLHLNIPISIHKSWDFTVYALLLWMPYALTLLILVD